MKTSAVCVKGEWRDVYKDPITARGSKSSKRGRMGVELLSNGEFAVRPLEDIDPQFDLMQNVFLNGEITNLQTFDQVRKRVGLLA
jgi:nicotinamide phosphoribosyltransferase